MKTISGLFLPGLLLLPALGGCRGPDRFLEGEEPDISGILRQAAEHGRDTRLEVYRTNVLTRIGRAQIRLGDLAGASKTIAFIPEDWTREDALQDLIEAYARQGDRGAARDALNYLDEGFRAYGEARLLQGMASFHARAGDFGQARAAAASITRGEMRAAAFADLAAHLWQAGDAAAAESGLAAAVKAAASREDEGDRALSYQTISRSLRGTGSDTSIRATLRTYHQAIAAVDDARDRAFDLKTIAVTQAEMGDRADARKTFQEAWEAATEIRDVNRAANMAQLIATAQAQAGFLEDALRSARAVPLEEGLSTRGQREEALRDVGLALAAATDLDGALEVAFAITDFMEFRDDVLVRVARGLAESGKVREALAFGRHFGSQSRRTQAVIEVALVQAKAGHRAAARRTARSVDLTQRSNSGRLSTGERFRFDRPATWGYLYEELRFVFTMVSHGVAVDEAADLAASTIRCHVALGTATSRRYARAFRDFDGEVLYQIAYAQADAGDARGALIWAVRMRSPHHRALAMLAVANALLDKRESSVQFANAECGDE